MNRSSPSLEDYLRLFESYGKDLGSLYKEPDDDHYALLFEQIVRLLIKPSDFNLSLPKEFRTTAERYLNNHPATVTRMNEPANRHFMLCDLHDLIMLKGGLAFKRKHGES